MRDPMHKPPETAEAFLVAVRDLLSAGPLCQYSMARNEDGERVSIDSQAGVCFCSVGAFIRVRGGMLAKQSDAESNARIILRRTIRAMCGLDLPDSYQITGWHDTRASLDEVLAVYDVAISVARKEAV